MHLKLLGCQTIAAISGPALGMTFAEFDAKYLDKEIVCKPVDGSDAGTFIVSHAGRAYVLEMKAETGGTVQAVRAMTPYGNYFLIQDDIMSMLFGEDGTIWSNFSNGGPCRLNS